MSYEAVGRSKKASVRITGNLDRNSFSKQAFELPESFQNPPSDMATSDFHQNARQKNKSVNATDLKNSMSTLLT